MNTKRIAATIGLVLIVVSVLCVVCVGILPQLRELLMTTSTVTFIGAAAILGILVYRRQNEENDGGNADDNSEKDA